LRRKGKEEEKIDRGQRRMPKNPKKGKMKKDGILSA